MFEHFTFGAQPQTPYQVLNDAFPSPTDTSFPSPLTPPPVSFPFPSNPTQAGINDIVAKLSQQSLQQKSRDQLVQQFQAWQNDDDIVVDDGDVGNPSDRITQTTSVPTTPVLLPRSTISCRRLQRQLNVQLQSSSRHIRDIHTLVEDMIVSNSQCTLRNITSRSYLSSPPPSRGRDVVDNLAIDPSEFDEARIGPDDVDEGFCDDESFGVDEDMELSLRRASTPGGIRKYNGIRYGRSADYVCIGGKLKVRSLPRMRKRKTQVSRVPE
jgi:hypothetical protein